MTIISFTLARRQFELSDDDVRARVANHRPDPIDQYWVDIEGVRWPVKQVMALSTGLSKTDFQSQNSRRLLAGLGFTIGKGKAALPPPTRAANASTPTVRLARPRLPHQRTSCLSAV